MRSAPIHFVICPTLSFLLLLLSFVPAFAQDRLVIGGPAATAEVGAIGHFGDNLGPRPDWALGALIGGGRYAVDDRGSLNLGDGSGTAAVVRAVGTGAPIHLAPGSILATDAIRSRVFVLRGKLPTLHVDVDDLEQGTSRSLAELRLFPLAVGGIATTGFPEVRYAQTAGALFVRRANVEATAAELAVVDVDSGAILRTLPDIRTPVLPAYSFEATMWLVSPDGALLVAHRDTRVEILSGASGATLGSADVTGGQGGLGAPFTSLFPDWAHGRVFALQGSPNRWTISVVAADTTLAGEIANAGYCPPRLVVSPHTDRGYLLFNTGSAGKYYGPIFTGLAAFDATARQLIAARDITDAFGFNTDLCGGLQLNLVTAPGPPRTLVGSVAGRDVTLSWTNVGDASNFVLDAGIAPGRTDLTFSIGATSPVTIPNAPPGTYYLRLRGTNAFGVSRPSNEAVVVVR